MARLTEDKLLCPVYFSIVARLMEDRGLYLVLFWHCIQIDGKQGFVFGFVFTVWPGLPGYNFLCILISWNKKCHVWLISLA